jgi:hypothetical protein
MDIVLGSWRYCINNQGNKAAAKEMMPSLIWLLGHRPHVDELPGLVMRPETVYKAAFRARYAALRDFIHEFE